MVIIPSGPIGLTVVQHVEEESRLDQEIAPTPLHSMVERTVSIWVQAIKHKNVTRIHAVSRHLQFSWYLYTLRDVNFGCWPRLGCSWKNVIIFSRQGLV